MPPPPARSRPAWRPIRSSANPHLGGSIDPYPFLHPDGTPYLLWKADGNAIGQPSTLFAQVLTADGLALVGEPTALITSGAAWERPLIENPAMVVAAQSFVLLYSGGWWESDGYAVGYATCDTPLGPCTKATVSRAAARHRRRRSGPWRRLRGHRAGG